MAYKRKYHPGEKITFLDELEKQEFIYCNGKIMNKGWFMSWPFSVGKQLYQMGKPEICCKE